MLGLHGQHFRHLADTDGFHCDAGPSTHCTLLWNHLTLGGKTGLLRRMAMSLVNMTSYLCAGLCARNVAVSGALHWEACPIFCPPFLWPTSTSLCPPCLTTHIQY